ncbi:hypothetical protein ACO3VM_00940 [Methanocaldococcus sp. 10A]
MQGNETLKNKILDIIKELEDINKKLNSKAIDKAIGNLKIAIYGDKVGAEGFYHSYIREKLLEIFKGNQYIESSGTKLSNLGFRPDLVIINDKKVIIAEIETDKKRAINKMRKIANLINNIKKHPIATNREVKVIFCLLSSDSKIINKAKMYGFELFVLDNGRLKKLC